MRLKKTYNLQHLIDLGFYKDEYGDYIYNSKEHDVSEIPVLRVNHDTREIRFISNNCWRELPYPLFKLIGQHYVENDKGE